VSIALGLAWVSVPAHAAAGTEYIVATTGSDTNDGTLTNPFATVEKGLKSLEQGDTLLVRDGVYPERIRNPYITAATSENNINVKNYPGEHPTIQGLFWLKNHDNWHVSGINVTWADTNASNEHMVKMTNGTGWSFTNSDIGNAHSYAGLLVVGTATNWTVANNYIHDTHPTNDINQDHLIYVNTETGGAGTIEHNLLVNSANGRAIKVGAASSSSTYSVDNITIRYNTMHNNLGPSNIQLAYNSNNNHIYRNIMTKPAANRSAVTAFQLTGTNNTIHDNLFYDAIRVADDNPGFTLSNNIETDPQYTTTNGKIAPTNPAAALY
jgi:hypothetical protein